MDGKKLVTIRSVAGSCFVIGCSNVARHIQNWEYRIKDIHSCPEDKCTCEPPFRLFHFPRRQNPLRRIWLELINRGDPRSPKQLLDAGHEHRVCSRHFVDGQPTREHPWPELHISHAQPDKMHLAQIDKYYQTWLEYKRRWGDQKHSRYSLLKSARPPEPSAHFRKFHRLVSEEERVLQTRMLWRLMNCEDEELKRARLLYPSVADIPKVVRAKVEAASGTDSAESGTEKDGDEKSIFSMSKKQKNKISAQYDLDTSTNANQYREESAQDGACPNIGALKQAEALKLLEKLKAKQPSTPAKRKRKAHEEMMKRYREELSNKVGRLYQDDIGYVHMARHPRELPKRCRQQGTHVRQLGLYEETRYQDPELENRARWHLMSRDLKKHHVSSKDDTVDINVEVTFEQPSGKRRIDTRMIISGLRMLVYMLLLVIRTYKVENSSLKQKYAEQVEYIARLEGALNPRVVRRLKLLGKVVNTRKKRKKTAPKKAKVSKSGYRKNDKDFPSSKDDIDLVLNQTALPHKGGQKQAIRFVETRKQNETVRGTENALSENRNITVSENRKITVGGNLNITVSEIGKCAVSDNRNREVIDNREGAVSDNRVSKLGDDGQNIAVQFSHKALQSQELNLTKVNVSGAVENSSGKASDGKKLCGECVSSEVSRYSELLMEEGKKLIVISGDGKKIMLP